MDKDDLQLVAGMEPLQHCMEVVGIDDKGEVVAYNHMVDNTDDIDQVEEASLDGHNVAFAASPNRACSPPTQKAHREDHLGMKQEHPFFEDPLMGSSFFPAEEVVDCYSKAFLGFGPGFASVI